MAVALTETATEGGVCTAPATEGGVCTAEDTDERTDTQLLRLLLRLSLPPAGVPQKKMHSPAAQTSSTSYHPPFESKEKSRKEASTQRAHHEGPEAGTSLCQPAEEHEPGR